MTIYDPNQKASSQQDAPKTFNNLLIGNVGIPAALLLMNQVAREIAPHLTTDTSKIIGAVISVGATIAGAIAMYKYNTRAVTDIDNNIESANKVVDQAIATGYLTSSDRSQKKLTA